VAAGGAAARSSHGVVASASALSRPGAVGGRATAAIGAPVTESGSGGPLVGQLAEPLLEPLAKPVADPLADPLAEPLGMPLGGGVIDDGESHVARLLRDRCIEGLRVRRDRAALGDCRTFGQQFPGHPSARALAFGAGGLAEELGALRDAVDAYSRAFLLSPLVGATGDDALLARSRVHAALGDLDEARSDLRIYLHRAPQARQDPEVARLLDALGLMP
jgi:tetratricopeptide (TPR) repeat protein